MDLVSLFEMDWYEKSPLTSVLRQHRGKWVHFSQGAPNRDWHNITKLAAPEKPQYYDSRANKRYQRELTAVNRKNATYNVPKLGINPKIDVARPEGRLFLPCKLVVIWS